MTPMPSLTASSASASPTRRLRSSDSTTHGPAMRNGLLSAANRWDMSVGQFGQRARRRVARAQRAVIARRADKAGDQRAVGGKTRAAHAVLREHVAIGVRDLVAVAVALAHLGGIVRLRHA